jgi:hypothetical protein
MYKRGYRLSWRFTHLNDDEPGTGLVGRLKVDRRLVVRNIEALDLSCGGGRRSEENRNEKTGFHDEG